MCQASCCASLLEAPCLFSLKQCALLVAHIMAVFFPGWMTLLVIHVIHHCLPWFSQRQHHGALTQFLFPFLTAKQCLFPDRTFCRPDSPLSCHCRFPLARTMGLPACSSSALFPLLTQGVPFLLLPASTTPSAQLSPPHPHCFSKQDIPAIWFLLLTFPLPQGPNHLDCKLAPHCHHGRMPCLRHGTNVPAPFPAFQ